MDMALSKQFVVVLNKKHETGMLMNTVAHLSAGIVNLNKERIEDLRFDNYIDKDGNNHPSISDHGFIVLRADNSNKLSVTK